MAAKSGENPNFTPLHRTLLYYPAGQKFARNCSISYGFRDNHTFSFSAKIQDGRQKWRKSKFFAFAQDTLVLPCGSKLCSKSHYLLRFSRYSHFFIYRKNPRWPPKVAKSEFFRLSTGHSCTTLWVKNSLEIALSVTVFEIFTLFHFPQKSKIAAKNQNFTPLYRTLLYYPAGQKFARNRSISYGFQDIHTFSFSAKIQDGRQKWRKSKFFAFAQDTLVLPYGSKLCSKSHYLLWFSRYSHFFIYRKNPRWPPKVAKIEIFRLSTGHSCTTLWVKNSLEIALSVTVFEIFTLFHFPQKSKIAAKNQNFTPLYRTLLYYPVGQKFARNRSISYGFQDIHTFSFSAKIQDGRQKWRKSKFFAFAQDTLVLPYGSKLCSKSHYLLRFSRYSHFFIYRKNPRWPPKVVKSEFFRLSTGHSCTTLWVKNLLEIALSVTVFEIFTLFHFPQKSKIAAKNQNFTPLYRTLLYYPAGQKFARNRSISYGFQDIHTFSFSAKIQDGRKSGENRNFSPLHRTLLYYLTGQNFARNRTICYGFRDIHTFSFTAKIQDGRQKW